MHDRQLANELDRWAADIGRLGDLVREASERLQERDREANERQTYIEGLERRLAEFTTGRTEIVVATENVERTNPLTFEKQMYLRVVASCGEQTAGIEMPSMLVLSFPEVVKAYTDIIVNLVRTVAP